MSEDTLDAAMRSLSETALRVKAERDEAMKLLEDLETLQAQAVAAARDNGRREMANEIVQWWVAHREELPQHLRDEFADLILKAGA